jgi:hypothetical protein
VRRNALIKHDQRLVLTKLPRTVFMNNTANASIYVPDTESNALIEDVFKPNDQVSFSVFRKVAPASISHKIPPGEILLDGSISFKTTEPSNQNIKLDRFGRIMEVSLTTGEKTTLGYNTRGELRWLKLSDGEVITKNDSGIFIGQTSRWTEIVPLMDGTLWCKRENDAIVQKHIDGTTTWQDIRRKFILWWDKQKRIVAIRYPNGQSRSFTYNATGIAIVTEPDGSKFILKDGAWQSDKDSTLKILDLTLADDGTLTYRVDNFLMSTTAAGKFERSCLAPKASAPAHSRTHSEQSSMIGETPPQPSLVEPSSLVEPAEMHPAEVYPTVMHPSLAQPCLVPA